MIVRWGLDSLPGVLEELSVSRPLLISTERWRELGLPVARGFYGAQPHAEVGGVREALAAAEGMDGLGGRVDPGVRHARPPGGGEARRGRGANDGDRLRAVADARPAARRERRHGDERARALRRGAVLARAQRGNRPGGAGGRPADLRVAAPGRAGRPGPRSAWAAARRR